MSDLSQLMQIAPLSAAAMMGQNQRQTTDEGALKQRELQAIIESKLQQMKQADQMNPLLVEEQGLKNRTSEAELPGKQAQSQSFGLKAQLEAATNPSAIQAGIAKNTYDAGTKEGDLRSYRVSKFLENAPIIGRIPVEMGQRTTAAKKMLADVGIDQSSPQGQQLYGLIERTNPEKLSEVMSAIANEIVRQSPKSIEEMDKQREVSRSHLEGIKSQGQTQHDVMQMQISAGRFDKKQVATDFKSQVDQQLLKAAGNVDAQYGILNRASVVAQQSNLPDLAMQYQQQAAALKNQVQARTASRANPQAGGVNVGEVAGLPVNPQLDVAPPPLSGQDASAPAITPAGQPQVKSLADVQRMYPGVPPDKLRAAYKKKFGVDLQ